MGREECRIQKCFSFQLRAFVADYYKYCEKESSVPYPWL